uniref:VWFA domain-containing protein n=1 Tax=Knipowitschia caucasica TaxID=637954 RepID=A0AAV2MGD8_KNICA
MVSTAQACSLDVVFVLDSSESVKTFLFQQEKAFVLRFSTQLSLLQVPSWSVRLRMGALHYSNSVSVDRPLSVWTDLDSFQDAVSTMRHIGQGTYTSHALTNASALLRSESAAGSVRVLLLLTDGLDHPRSPDPAPAADRLKAQGVRVFTVGLSGLAQSAHNHAKLRALASSPPQQFVHSLLEPGLEEKLLTEMREVAVEECGRAHVCLCQRGERGSPGSQGLKGKSGYRGEPGLKGSRGEAGRSGTPGSKGAQGDQGPSGTPGAPGDSEIGFPGPKVKGPREHLDLKGIRELRGRGFRVPRQVEEMEGSQVLKAAEDFRVPAPKETRAAVVPLVPLVRPVLLVLDLKVKRETKAQVELQAPKELEPLAHQGRRETLGLWVRRVSQEGGVLVDLGLRERRGYRVSEDQTELRVKEILETRDTKGTEAPVDSLDLWDSGVLRGQREIWEFLVPQDPSEPLVEASQELRVSLEPRVQLEQRESLV